MRAFVIAFLLVIVFLLPLQTFAQENQASPSAQTVDVYSLFWPVVPGKTVSDSMFWAKQLKENLGGLFKFGSINQASYKTEIAEKRFVESYKLLEDKDYDNAFKSLELNKAARAEAVKLKKKALEEKQDTLELTKKLVKSLENQQKALIFIQTQLPEDQKSKLEAMINELTLQTSEAK